VSEEQVEAALTALKLRPDDVVVLSFELPRTPLRRAADMAHSAGARLVVNPAPARLDYADLLVGAIVTPNAAELAALQRAQSGQREAALALSARIAAPVVVTLGADGALLAESGEVTRFPAHVIEARDTTGAGDTVTGVLAASLAQGHEAPAAVRRAVAAAALAVTQEGARTGMPTAHEIDRLLEPGTE